MIIVEPIQHHHIHVSDDYHATNEVLAKSSPQLLFQVTQTGKEIKFPVVEYFELKDSYEAFRNSGSFNDFYLSYSADISTLNRLIERFFDEPDCADKLSRVDTFRYNLFVKADDAKVIDHKASYYRRYLYGEARLEFHRVVNLIEDSPLNPAEQKTIIGDMADGLDTCTGGVQSRIATAFRKLHYSYLGANGALKNLCFEIAQADAMRFFHITASNRNVGEIFEIHVVNHLLKSIDAMFAIDEPMDGSGEDYKSKFRNSDYTKFSQQVSRLLTASNMITTICNQHFDRLMNILETNGLISNMDSVVELAKIKGEILEQINLLVLEPINSFLLSNISFPKLLNSDGTSNGICFLSLACYWVGIIQRQYRSHFNPISEKVCTLVTTPNEDEEQHVASHYPKVKQAWGNFFWVEHNGKTKGLTVYQIMLLAEKESNKTILTGYLDALEINSLEEALQCLNLLASNQHSILIQQARCHKLVQFRVFYFFNEIINAEFERWQQASSQAQDCEYVLNYNQLMPLQHLTTSEFETLHANSEFLCEVCIIIEQARRGIFITPMQVLHLYQLGKLELILQSNCQLTPKTVEHIFSLLITQYDSESIGKLYAFVHAKDPSSHAELQATWCPSKLLDKVVKSDDFQFTTDMLKLFPNEVTKWALNKDTQNGSLMHYCMLSNHLNAFNALLASGLIELNQMTSKGTLLQAALSNRKYKPFLEALLTQDHLSLFFPLSNKGKCNFDVAVDDETQTLLTTALAQRLKQARTGGTLFGKVLTELPTSNPKPKENWEGGWEQVDINGELNILLELIQRSFAFYSIEELVSELNRHRAINWQSAPLYLKNLAWSVRCSDWIANPESTSERTQDFMQLLPSIHKSEMADWLEFAQLLNVKSLKAAIIINYFNQNQTDKAVDVELGWLFGQRNLIPKGSFGRHYSGRQHALLLTMAIKTGAVGLVEHRMLLQVVDYPLNQPLLHAEGFADKPSTCIPLIYAINANQAEVAIKIAELDPRQISTFCPSVQANALQRAACRLDSQQLLQAMLPHCNVNQEDSNGYSVLDLALNAQNMKNVEQLLTHKKIDLFCRSKSGHLIYQMVQERVTKNTLDHAIVLTSGHSRNREKAVDIEKALIPLKAKRFDFFDKIVDDYPFVCDHLNEFNLMLAKCDYHSLQALVYSLSAGFKFYNEELKQGAIRILQAHVAVRYQTEIVF
ncbi:hypothetical protein [Parashewanella curva]|nr:hypothetical protein [Parashewanella curva]